MLRRDALYRRMLAAGDLVATSLALFIAVVVVSGGKLDIGSAIALPLVILLGKIVGLHDRDEHLLRKTTLEEVPTIVAVGTLLTFMIWLSNGASIDGELTRGQTGLLWGLVVTLLVVTRTATRTIARGLVSEERCLVLGGEESARAMSRKFAVSFAVKARVVGRVPLGATRRRMRRGTASCRDRRRSARSRRSASSWSSTTSTVSSSSRAAWRPTGRSRRSGSCDRSASR